MVLFLKFEVMTKRKFEDKNFQCLLPLSEKKT